MQALDLKKKGLHDVATRSPKSREETCLLSQRNKHIPRTDTARYGLSLHMPSRNWWKICAVSVHLAIHTAMRRPAWINDMDARTRELTPIARVGEYERKPAP